MHTIFNEFCMDTTQCGPALNLETYCKMVRKFIKQSQLSDERLEATFDMIKKKSAFLTFNEFSTVFQKPKKENLGKLLRIISSWMYNHGYFSSEQAFERLASSVLQEELELHSFHKAIRINGIKLDSA